MKFFIATPDGPLEVDGWMHRFVGIHSTRPDTWSVTHVPSGHRFGVINASFGAAKAMAKEVAELTDWGAFNGIDGWKNVDPDLPSKVRAFADECDEFIIVSGAGGSQQIAAAVAERVGA